MDGGTTWNINIIGAIEECRKLVEKDSDIVLDIILLIPDHIDPLPPIEDNDPTWKNYIRYRTLKGEYNTLNDVVEFIQAHPNLTYRYLI